MLAVTVLRECLSGMANGLPAATIFLKPSEDIYLRSRGHAAQHPRVTPEHRPIPAALIVLFPYDNSQCPSEDLMGKSSCRRRRCR